MYKKYDHYKLCHRFMQIYKKKKKYLLFFGDQFSVKEKTAMI